VLGYENREVGAEDRRPGTEDWKQETEDCEPGTEDRRLKTEAEAGPRREFAVCRCVGGSSDESASSNLRIKKGRSF